MGSHNYQHVAVDPCSGDIYLRFAGNLYRYTGRGMEATVTVIPFNFRRWRASRSRGGADPIPARAGMAC